MSIGIGLNGTIGSSQGQSTSVGGSLGSSASYGYNQSGSDHIANSWSNSWSNSENWSDSNAENWGNSWSEARDEGYSRVYGREASAQDIINAREANAVQRDLWAEQAAYNAKEAERNRQYQAYMSNTAYQRAVADLLKAGLNPILAVGNMGASTPAGSTASSGLAASNKANAHAESTSYNRGYSNSASNSYGYSKSNSYGYSKGGSESKSTERSSSWGKGENWSNSNDQSWNRSNSWERSNTSNNIANVAESAIGALDNLFPKTNSKSVTNSISNAVKNLFGKGTTYHKSSSGKNHGGRSGKY